jgi:serine/threonine protein kinase
MAERVHPGAIIDGISVGALIHKGGTGSIFRATAPPERDPGYPLAIKAPRIGRGESSINIASFEIEQTILPTLTGPHVPKFVTTGDLAATPYIVMEWIEGQGVGDFVERAPLPPEETARIGAALADAVQSIHAQEVIHLDIKPENFILRPSGEAVLLDFGFARHARFPDLLAEEQQFAAGSAAYVSPEQLQDDRGDPRSDLFALGVILYELATGRQPFGAPMTLAGMRDRLWRAPIPPRAANAELPPWLQEIILRCLEGDPDIRYQSAAHLALDLRHPDQVTLTERAERVEATSFFGQVARWWRSWRGAGSTRASQRLVKPGPMVIMVAVDTEHPDDERHSPLQKMTAAIVAMNPDARLMFVSVIKSPPVGEGPSDADTSTGRHIEHTVRLRHWVEPLKLPPSRISLHVIEAISASDALLELARVNHAGLIVLGAPLPSRRTFGWWRSAASTITANAPCSVFVVRVPERDVDRSVADTSTAPSLESDAHGTSQNI